MLRRPAKVLLLQGVPKSALKVFTADKNFQVEICNEPLTEAQLAKKVEDVNVLCIGPRNSEELTDEIIRSAHRLLAIGCFSGDTAAVDVQCSSQMGIPVFSSPYGNSYSQAEYALGNIILLARQLGDRNGEMRAGNWQKKSANCYEIRGKTLGIIGYGHVGSQLGILAEFFGMKVVWYDLLPLMPIGNSTPVDTMAELLKISDFVSIHISDTPENANLIKKEHLAMMRKGTFLLNGSNGKAVDLPALAESLKSGHLYGASLDSFPEGKTSAALPLLKDLPNVLLTPNLAGHSREANDRIGYQVANHVHRFLTEGCTQGSVNFPVIETRPAGPNKTRILNVHKNVRGVVRAINDLLSNTNISKQVLDTKDTLGYTIIDLDQKEDTTEILTSLALLANSIRTRCI